MDRVVWRKNSVMGVREVSVFERKSEMIHPTVMLLVKDVFVLVVGLSPCYLCRRAVFVCGLMPPVGHARAAPWFSTLESGHERPALDETLVRSEV